MSKKWKDPPVLFQLTSKQSQHISLIYIGSALNSNKICGILEVNLFVNVPASFSQWNDKHDDF